MVYEGKLIPAELQSKKKELEDRAKSTVKATKVSKPDTLEVRNARAKSVERANIKVAFSGMTRLENHYFEDLLKNTMKQIGESNEEYKTLNLMQKIKEKGSQIIKKGFATLQKLENDKR